MIIINKLIIKKDKKMIADFMNFCNNIKSNDVNEYFNCYSSFIMSRKDLRDNVLNHRMNFLVSYYIDQNNKIDKNKLIAYYSKNYKDNYPTDTLNIQYHKFTPEPEEKRDDDVEMHYKDMFTIPPPPKEEDQESEEEYYEEQQEVSDYYNEYDELDDYDYYNEYEDDIDLEEFLEEDEEDYL